MTIRDAIDSMMIKNHNGIGYTLVGDDDMPNLDGLTMESGTLGFNYSDVEEEKERLQAEYDAQEYARKRAVAYPSVQECVHAILDDQLDALQAKRAEIKTKYPKG
jgi:hypothetical protein